MSKKIRQYKVKVSYTYTGTVDVRAESKTEAVNIVKDGFGLSTSINVRSFISKDEDVKTIVDYDVNLNPSLEHIY